MQFSFEGASYLWAVLINFVILCRYVAIAKFDTGKKYICNRVRVTGKIVLGNRCNRRVAYTFGEEEETQEIFRKNYESICQESLFQKSQNLLYHFQSFLHYSTKGGKLTMRGFSIFTARGNLVDYL